MKKALNRWSVNAIADHMTPITYYCDGRPLASNSRAERETLTPVQHLLVGLAGCFALSCQAVFLKHRLKDLGLEIVVTGERSKTPDNGLSEIRISAIFRGNLNAIEAAAIVEEAKPLCTVANTVVSTRVVYETRTLVSRRQYGGAPSQVLHSAQV